MRFYGISYWIFLIPRLNHCFTFPNTEERIATIFHHSKVLILNPSKPWNEVFSDILYRTYQSLSKIPGYSSFILCVRIYSKSDRIVMYISIDFISDLDIILINVCRAGPCAASLSWLYLRLLTANKYWHNSYRSSFGSDDVVSLTVSTSAVARSSLA